jgi:hypothetical protein
VSRTPPTARDRICARSPPQADKQVDHIDSVYNDHDRQKHGSVPALSHYRPFAVLRCFGVAFVSLVASGSAASLYSFRFAIVTRPTFHFALGRFYRKGPRGRRSPAFHLRLLAANLVSRVRSMSLC